MLRIFSQLYLFLSMSCVSQIFYTLDAFFYWTCIIFFTLHVFFKYLVPRVGIIIAIIVMWFRPNQRLAKVLSVVNTNSYVTSGNIPLSKNFPYAWDISSNDKAILHVLITPRTVSSQSQPVIAVRSGGVWRHASSVFTLRLGY